MGKLERNHLIHYIDANMGELTPNYIRIGKDLEEYNEELNPQVNVQRNLRGEPEVSLGGYEVESEVETFYADPDNALFSTLMAIANRRLTEDSCRTTKVDVLLDENDNQLWAYREDCLIVPTSVGGDTSGVQVPFKVYCEGNRVYGQFDFETLEFSSGGEPEPSGGGIVPLSVKRNGTYEAPEKQAYSPVVVNVPQEYDISELSVTNNGYYEAPEGEAYDRVSVSVDQGGAVDSVNGMTGDVVLGKTDIGLGNVANVLQYSADNPQAIVHVGASAPSDSNIQVWLDTDEAGMSAVSSVNAKTGTVVLDADDVGATAWELLWENASPTSAFTAQTVSLDLSGYDYYGIVQMFHTSEQKNVGMQMFEVTTGQALLTVSGGSSSYCGRRNLVYNNNGLEFSACVINGSTNNAYAIPYKIYGIKGVITT